MRRTAQKGWVWKGMGVAWKRKELFTFPRICWLYEMPGGGPVPKHLGLPWYKKVSGFLVNSRRFNFHVIVMFRRDDGW
jgi:hypothetical protein